MSPPRIDQNGYGLRVPGLVISPYARAHLIDHQVLSHDAYLKFIEDDFLGGERLNPATDGRPDQRPDVRESNPALGDLSRDFDFSQPPAPPFQLPTHPAAWSLPTAFRLLLTRVPLRQTPRLHKGGLVLGLTCTTNCRLSVSGYLTISLPGGRHVHVLPASATFTGTRAVRVALSRSSSAIMRRALARGSVQARLFVTASQTGASATERASTHLTIALAR
jgi:hypothetical protein